MICEDCGETVLDADIFDSDGVAEFQEIKRE
jgi:hypothetical protein